MALSEARIGADAVPYRGYDLPARNRPGVPMEAEPRPAGGAHWAIPARQPPTPLVTKRVELPMLPPVFGTAQPPRGLSGALRRLAYCVPEHRARHWMLLLLADRVDALEHGRARQWLAPAVVLLAAAAAIPRSRRRSRLRWV